MLVWPAKLSVGVGVCAGGVGRVLGLTHSPRWCCLVQGRRAFPGSFGSGLAVCSHVIHPTVSLRDSYRSTRCSQRLRRSASVGTCSRALS